MPNGYSDVNLPAVTFELYRVSGKVTEDTDIYNEKNLFATQTVTNWADAHKNGTYVFNFTDENGEMLDLPRYDAEGNVYTYYMRENLKRLATTVRRLIACSPSPIQNPTPTWRRTSTIHQKASST